MVPITLYRLFPRGFLAFSTWAEWVRDMLRMAFSPRRPTIPIVLSHAENKFAVSVLMIILASWCSCFFLRLIDQVPMPDAMTAAAFSTIGGTISILLIILIISLLFLRPDPSALSLFLQFLYVASLLFSLWTIVVMAFYATITAILNFSKNCTNGPIILKAVIAVLLIICIVYLLWLLSAYAQAFFLEKNRPAAALIFRWSLARILAHLSLQLSCRYIFNRTHYLHWTLALGLPFFLRPLSGTLSIHRLEAADRNGSEMVACHRNRDILRNGRLYNHRMALYQDIAS
jgi:hypothetical protein